MLLYQALYYVPEKDLPATLPSIRKSKMNMCTPLYSKKDLNQLGKLEKIWLTSRSQNRSGLQNCKLRRCSLHSFTKHLYPCFVLNVVLNNFLMLIEEWNYKCLCSSGINSSDRKRPKWCSSSSIDEEKPSGVNFTLRY